MNRMIRKVGFTILIGYGGLHAASTPTLQNIFHNKTHTTEKGPYIELGTVVLYFDSYPKVDQISLVPGMHGERRTFLLRDVQIQQSPKLRADIAKLNQETGDAYTVRISSVTKPAKGLLLEVTYDPKKVGIRHEEYPAVTLQPSIVFHFDNKPFINRLTRNTKPITIVASRSHPKTVVIDCGHGGSDSGTIGCNNVAEKDVSLQVGLSVAQLLKADGFTVVLSRAGDATVALDERTTFANKNRADVFVSIHANSASNKNTSGIETYCLTPELFKAGGCTLDRGAAQCCKDFFKERCQQSSLLANSVHSELLSLLRGERHTIVDRHVRHAVPQVLLGVGMPAVLVEIGFLSHPHEAQLLADAAYQKKIACGIERGIFSFFQTTEHVL